MLLNRTLSIRFWIHFPPNRNLSYKPIRNRNLCDLRLNSTFTREFKIFFPKKKSRVTNHFYLNQCRDAAVKTFVDDTYSLQ